jgi:hypothetical protein
VGTEKRVTARTASAPGWTLAPVTRADTPTKLAAHMGPEHSLAMSVPVALFVYRRHEQLRRTLACLRDSGIERLYVFSDGPRDAAAADDVARVRELVSALDWIEPVMFARTENLGLSESIRFGLDRLFTDHDTAVVVEDDVCVAPEFYDYACRALAHYGDAEHVAGITGLRYPFSRRVLDDYPFDVFLSPRFSSWGWATWKDRWERFVFDHATLRRQLAARSDLRPERAGADMRWMLEQAVVEESLTGAWDASSAANMLLHDLYFDTPTWNMVENSGLLEGTHQAGQAPAWRLAWEPEHRPELDALRFAPVAEDARVLQAYLKFFALSRRQTLITAIGRLRHAVAHQ